jgi:hypothetical protein
MGTLNVYGMGPAGFKVNRPLEEYEIEHRFDITQPASSQPHYELSLTKLNSTFVECVDKWYSARGSIAMAAGLASALFLLAIIGWIYLTTQDGDVVALWLLVIPVPALFFTMKFFLTDAFTYTHYPIRFNRKNRQVYVFRRDGTVLKVGWDDVYWTIHKHGMNEACVMGHLFASDGETIKESFALSVETSAVEAGEQNLRNHFEFFRRYMQEGPAQVLEALKPTPLIMLPGIYKKRESWAFGWERSTLNINGFLLAQIIFQVFFIPMSLFRWVVMYTSKIPQWPQWVEDECAIEAGDPWERDERHRAK